MSSSSFQEAERNNCTPLDRSLKDFPGRREGLQRRRIALNYDAKMEILLREESHTSGHCALEEQSVKTGAEGNITSIHDIVAELKEMAQVQHQKQLAVGQMEPNANEDIGAEGTVKSVGLDPILDPLQSPSRWPLEFERKQHEIVELWHACNVSLIHRTYFFILFKGDPTDSIYMEVEHRRLSFLKNSISQGNFDKAEAGDSHNLTLVSSLRNLRREREMLYRQMFKRMAVGEKENLYSKWGIALNSKKRRLQLSQQLWTKTNMEHVQESASLVAKLIGLLEPEQALKEMFGLSFIVTPQLEHRRSYSWKRGNSFVM